MNRRGFFGALTALAAAPVLPAAPREAAYTALVFNDEWECFVGPAAGPCMPAEFGSVENFRYIESWPGDILNL